MSGSKITSSQPVQEGNHLEIMADEGPRYPRRETLLTMLSVLLVMLLASLDQTIVGTAMPRIIAELHGFEHYTWVTTSYLLASTVMVPIYGKLSDLLGRKPVFLFGLIVFMIGSWLSGAAQTMNQLVAFRGLQGLGAAALLPIAIAIVGDLFTPRERARWQGVTGAVFGLSSIIGPAVGGYLTEHASWRWVFYVNLPLGVIALLTLVFLMPTLVSPAKHVKIDYVGAALLIAGTVPLLLGLSWAGTDYAWLSPQILGMFAFAFVAVISFIWYEARLARNDGQPIIEPSLFKNRIFSISVLITVISNMGLFGSIFFLPLFVQGVVGTSITSSGFVLTPLMITAIAGSIVSGQVIARRGKYKANAIIGMVVSVFGTLMLLRLGLHSTNLDVIVAMVVLGLGMGVGMSLYTLIVQNALPTKIGQATSALTFFRSIGSTIALAAMGTMMNASYLPAFQSAVPAAVQQTVPAQAIAAFNNPQVLLSPEAQAQMSSQFAALGAQGQAIYASLLEAVKVGLVQGIHAVFILSFVIMIIGLIAVFFLQEIELRGGPRRSPTANAEQAPMSSEPVMSMH
ncbi:MAG TPA: MDR family MFS transporter [Roseiflexaceae bacterium]|jgi:EmrB/QacA subfamily drug resistance transporter|nr:MDR family MFS transporter [Roseiflexaceae bacterium]